MWYVHTPIEKAVEQAVDRAVKDGRTLPISVLAEGHYDAQAAFRSLLRQHAINADVDLAVLDNTNGPGTTKKVADPVVGGYKSQF
jgi:methylmalonyl-CoA mutase cobalamin-binding subunit